MLDEGTTQRPALQLAAELDRIGASLRVASSSDSISLNLGVLRKNVDPAFGLLADVALHPAFDDRELRRVRNDRLTAYQQAADDPDVLAARAFDRALYGAGHPYGYTEAGTAASLAAIGREDLQRFWQAGFVPTAPRWWSAATWEPMNCARWPRSISARGPAAARRCRRRRRRLLPPVAACCWSTSPARRSRHWPSASRACRARRRTTCRWK